jgi:hypothetical protein
MDEEGEHANFAQVYSPCVQAIVLKTHMGG